MTQDVRRDEQSSRWFQQLLETAPDAIVVVDEQGCFQFVNAQTEALFGYSRAELLGQPVELLIPERLRAQHTQYRRSFAATPKLRPMGSGRALVGRHKDGSEVAIEVSLSPLTTERGTVVSAAIRDIRERRQMEAREKLASDRLLSAVESIQDAFALFDHDERFVLLNSAFRRTFSHLTGQLIGERFDCFLDRAIVLGIFDLGGESPEAFRTRWLAYRLDPKGNFEVKTTEHRYLRITDRRTAEGGVVTTIWDLTDDMQREEELRQARALAEAASAAKTEFLSSMSHELRTPLNAILGFSQLLQRDRKAPLIPRQQGMVEQVIKAGEHLLRLIDDVLDLARIEMGNIPLSMEPVAISAVLNEAKILLGPMATRAGIQIEIAPLPNDFPMVTADRTRFAQVMMNYGSNAIKYGRQGGKVLFQAKVVNDLVRISVVDDGLGISVEKHAKVFQPFQRAGQEAGPIEGTGIGLTISKKLTEMMGGRVGFQSKLGEGSEFWVELPIPLQLLSTAEKHKNYDSRAISSLQEGRGARCTVLYIEDNPSNIAFMEALVAEFERVELICAPTAEIGIELARDRLPGVVLMDINLPGMSGFDALRRLREWEETAHIPVIALSAAAMDRDKRRAEQAGFYRYLTKPVRVNELADVLEMLIGAEVMPAE